MNDSEEQERLNKYRIIIKEIGFAGLTDTEDMFLRDYLDGKNGYCVQVAESLVDKAHGIIKNKFQQSK